MAISLVSLFATTAATRILVLDLVEKSSDAALIEQVDCTNGAVTLFGDDDLCLTALVALRILVLVTIDKHDEIRVLLDRA